MQPNFHRVATNGGIRFRVQTFEFRALTFVHIVTVKIYFSLLSLSDKFLNFLNHGQKKN